MSLTVRCCKGKNGVKHGTILQKGNAEGGYRESGKRGSSQQTVADAATHDPPLVLGRQDVDRLRVQAEDLPRQGEGLMTAQQLVFDLWCIQGDRLIHQSLHGSREAAQAQARRYPKCMAVVWDLGYSHPQPVWWDRLEYGSEFYRRPVLEWEAYLAEAAEARPVVPKPPKKTIRDIDLEHQMATQEDWTKIPRQGKHVHETVARRIHYEDGKIVRTEWKEPDKPAQPANNEAAWEKWRKRGTPLTSREAHPSEQ